MNYIWVLLILISIITGAITGKLDAVVFSMLESSKKAVEICLGLVGIMAFWLGIMKIAKEAGIIEKFAKMINPIMKKIFNELVSDIQNANGNIEKHYPDGKKEIINHPEK